MMAGQWRYAEGDWVFDLIRTIQRFFSYFSNLIMMSENILTYHCELFNGDSAILVFSVVKGEKYGIYLTVIYPRRGFEAPLNF